MPQWMMMISCFTSLSTFFVILRWWRGDDERFCEMKFRKVMSWTPSLLDSNLGPQDLKLQVLTTQPHRHLDLPAYWQSDHELYLPLCWSWHKNHFHNFWSILTLCMLGNFACIFAVCGFFFSKFTFTTKSFRNTIRVSNSLAPDQARPFYRAWSGSKLFA